MKYFNLSLAKKRKQNKNKKEVNSGLGQILLLKIDENEAAKRKATLFKHFLKKLRFTIISKGKKERSLFMAQNVAKQKLSMLQLKS